MRRRDYVAQGRYGYGAIDEYRIENGNRSCQRTTVAGITQKLSRSLAIELNSAYVAGIKDALAVMDEYGFTLASIELVRTELLEGTDDDA